MKDHPERGALRLHKLQFGPHPAHAAIAARGLLLGASGCVSAAGPQSAVLAVNRPRELIVGVGHGPHW